MSRGLGETQRFVLAQLALLRDEEPAETFPPFRFENAYEIARRLSGREEASVTDAEVESVRRAFRTLAARGLVEVSRRRLDPGRGPWLFVARLPLSVEEQSTERERQHLEMCRLLAEQAAAGGGVQAREWT